MSWLLCTSPTTRPPQLDYRYGERSYKALREAGVNVDFKPLPGIGHSITYEEMADVLAFMAAALPAAPADPA